MSLDRTGRCQRFAFLSAAFVTPKLSAVMALVFVSLSIPVLVFILVFILVYNYNRRPAAPTTVYNTRREGARDENRERLDGLVPLPSSECR